MRLTRSDSFKKEYRRLPTDIQKKVDRQLGFLSHDFRYPSLHTKKVKGVDGVWEARVDLHNRITFQVTAGEIQLRHVGPHDILKKA